MKNNDQQGSVLLALVLILPFLLLITAAFLQLATSSLRIAQRDQLHTHAQLATDAGIDEAMYEINQDTTWTGTGSEVELHNDGKVKTTYEVSVTDVDADNKTLTTTGRSYAPAGASTPSSTVTIKVELRPVNTGSYSIVSGVGGLIMQNSAKIVNGNVFINGTLTMSNTAQIGLSFLPVNVQVAHQSCPNPADSTFPRVCAPGESGEPISISSPAHIYGEVKATNQTNGDNMSDTGLVTGSTVTPVALPSYDRDAQKAAVANNITGTDASCNFGTQTWAANTKITGDVNVQNLCIVTVEGDVWITGNLSLKNLGIIKVKSGLATPPVIMIDGSSGLSLRNASAFLSNSDGVGFRIITFYSTAACSPDCADVTGTDLANSQGLTTISVQNASSGSNTEFYAHWTKISAGNSGAIGALAGQTVELQNSLAVTFGTSVSGFSNSIWVINNYQREFQ